MLIFVERISHYNLLNISSDKYKYIYFKKKYTIITKPPQCYDFHVLPNSPVHFQILFSNQALLTQNLEGE